MAARRTRARGDVVDPCFPAYAENLSVFVAGPKALATAAHDFSQGNVAGARLDLAHLNQKIAS